MPRSYYSNYISNFLVESTESILGKLTRNNPFEEQRNQQRNAWIAEIEILKEQLKNLGTGYILFEYSIPRMGRRTDVILIVNGLVIVLEFKINQFLYGGPDIDQCLDYALDLKYFHQESHNAKIVPILVASNAPDENNKIKIYEDGIFVPLKCNSHNLNETILNLCQEHHSHWCHCRHRQPAQSVVLPRTFSI